MAMFCIQMLSRIVLQRIKEQCELLELIVLYYGNFEMKTEKLCFFAKLFKGRHFLLVSLSRIDQAVCF